MSSFASMVLVLGLFLANAFLIVVLDRWVDNIVETIVSGVVRGSGARVPMSYRRRILQVNFLTTGSGYVGAEAALAVIWVVLARSAAYEEVRLVAYLIAFMNAVGVGAWFLAIPLYYRYLAGVLRDAEAGP